MTLPACDYDDHTEERERVQHKGRADSGHGNDETGQSRANGPRQIELDPVQSHGRSQIFS